MSMVITKLHFFQVERESFFGHAVKFDESFFGEAPKPLESIDVDFTSSKSFPMVDFQMFIPAEHQRVVAFEFISVNDRTAFNDFNGFVEQRFGGYVLYDRNADLPMSLQNAEYRHFAGCTAATSTFPPTSEIRLVQLNLSPEKGEVFCLLKDCVSDQMRSFQGCRIADPNFLGNPTSRYLQFKELDDPEPLFGPDVQLADPTTSKVPKCITTTGATISFASQSVYSSTLASDTEPALFAPAFSSEIQTTSALALKQVFKGF